MKSCLSSFLLFVLSSSRAGAFTPSQLATTSSTKIQPHTNFPYRKTMPFNQPNPKNPSSRCPVSTQLHMAIHPIPQHLLTSMIPPLMGLYKSEYTVSLGYGTAVAWTAYALAKQFGTLSGTASIAALHALALVFYGVRLDIFLIVRNILSKRVQEFNGKVEAKASERIKRLPFIVSCGLLYYGLSIPLWFSAQLMTGAGTASGLPQWAIKAFSILVGAQWVGFGIAALGDLTKTYVKQTQKNERFLVTSGIFSVMRHPNYSGEIIGWTANAAVGLLSAALWIKQPTATNLANLAALGLGWVGIVFVLLMATSNLEKRQENDYGDTSKFQDWKTKSWGGWQLPTKKVVEEEHAEPQIEPDKNQKEDSGSGI